MVEKIIHCPTYVGLIRSLTEGTAYSFAVENDKGEQRAISCIITKLSRVPQGYGVENGIRFLAITENATEAAELEMWDGWCLPSIDGQSDQGKIGPRGEVWHMQDSIKYSNRINDKIERLKDLRRKLHGEPH